MARGNGRVVATEARREVPPVGYDPSQFPAFAVTVDVVILTMSAGKLHMLLVQRGEAPFEGMGDPWWVQASHRDLGRGRETRARRGNGCRRAEPAHPVRGVGDPERDPRMNVVTVGYLAVLRDVGAVMAGTDAAVAALVPVSDVLNGRIELAFDHLQIVRDAIERVRVELEVTGIATAFVGTTFTLAELGRCTRPSGGAARRSELPAQHRRGGRLGDPHRAPSAASGGRPAELYRAGRAWSHGGPIHRFQRDERK